MTPSLKTPHPAPETASAWTLPATNEVRLRLDRIEETLRLYEGDRSLPDQVPRLR
jgi:hypothetical protein